MPLTPSFSLSKSSKLTVCISLQKKGVTWFIWGYRAKIKKIQRHAHRRRKPKTNTPPKHQQCPWKNLPSHPKEHRRCLVKHRTAITAITKEIALLWTSAEARGDGYLHRNDVRRKGHGLTEIECMVSTYSFPYWISFGIYFFLPFCKPSID